MVYPGKWANPCYNHIVHLWNGISNLNNIFENLIDNNSRKITYSGSNIKDVELIIQKKNTFKKFTNSKINIVTDIFTESDQIDANIKVNRIIAFIEEYFPKSNISKLLVPKSDYDKNPFYGLNELPNFLSPFSKSFLEEITFLKSNTYRDFSFVVVGFHQKWELNLG
mgnify:CR=1 FL=1